MLSNIFKDKKEVTDRDIAKELESRGYSNQEIDKILNEAKQEQQKDKESFWMSTLKIIGAIIAVGLVVIIAVLVIFFSNI